jgi:LysM repeat protein
MFSKSLIRFYLVVFVLSSSFFVASAQDNPEVKWKDGKKYIVHKIQKGETWSGIAVKYKAPMKELQAINPKAKELKFDQAILIPYDNYLKLNKLVSGDNKVENADSEKLNKSDSGSIKQNNQALSNAKDSLKRADKNIERDNQIQQKKSDGSNNKLATKKQTELNSNANVITYKVKAGETLYRIATTHNMNYNDLAKFNGLKSTNVQAGQTIKIPINNTVASNEVKEQPKADSENINVNANTSSSSSTTSNVNGNHSTAKNEIEHHNAYSYHESNGSITEQGVATWIMESSVSKNEKFYALHRSAPMGTIIKVNNPMSNRSVFVKVVGVLPDTGDNHDVLIKITQSAARRIGIFESRFRVEISYKSK